MHDNIRWSEYFLEQMTESLDSSEEERWFRDLKNYQSTFEGFGARYEPLLGKTDVSEIVEVLKHKNRKLVAEWLERFYLRDTLNRIPKMVSRTLKLVALRSSPSVPGQVDEYLRQATRSYIYGFWDSCVALSRASLEQALRSAAGKRVNAKNACLSDLVRSCDRLRLLDSEHVKLAYRIEKAGNEVLHNQSCTDAVAWQVLSDVRTVLTFLLCSP